MIFRSLFLPQISPTVTGIISVAGLEPSVPRSQTGFLLNQSVHQAPRTLDHREHFQLARSHW